MRDAQEQIFALREVQRAAASVFGKLNHRERQKIGAALMQLRLALGDEVHIKNDADPNCTKCRGRGYYVDPVRGGGVNAPIICECRIIPDTHICPPCRGSGEVEILVASRSKVIKGPCSPCRGTGRVPSPAAEGEELASGTVEDSLGSVWGYRWTAPSPAQPAASEGERAWPEDDEPMDFEALAAPITNAIRFAYSIRRQNRDQDIPWIGPDQESANCLPARAALTAENLQYSEDDQGRDALDEIVGVAIRLGIEQGRRIFKQGPEYKTLNLKLQLAEMLNAAPPPSLPQAPGGEVERLLADMAAIRFTVSGQSVAEVNDWFNEQSLEALRRLRAAAPPSSPPQAPGGEVELWAVLYLYDWDPDGKVYPEIRSIHADWREAEAIKKASVEPDKYRVRGVRVSLPAS